MSSTLEKTSSIKVGWDVCWSAFWTGLPFKLIVAVVLLAMQVHPWEGAGLTALLVISIPIDIWALRLTARTYFLERYSMELEGPIGLKLWWQGAIIGAAFLSASYYVVPAAASIGKQIDDAVVAGIKKIFPGFPIAEQITLDVLLLSIPPIIAGVVLALVALQVYGWRIKRTVESSGHPSPEPFVERVRRWDYYRVPRDQALMFLSFAAVIVLVTLVFWIVLPVTTPHPSEEYKTEVAKPVKPVKPEDTLKRTETSLAKAEAVLHTLEQEKAKEKKEGKKKPEQTPDLKPKAEQKGK
jgi:hypothetical protein